MKKIVVPAIAGLALVGLAACSSSSGGSSSGPQSWCWHWQGSSDGSAVVGNSLGNMSCTDGDAGKLLPPAGSSYAYSSLGNTQGYAANEVPANDGLACSSVPADPKELGGWRVYVGTSGYDAAQDFCNQLQQEAAQGGMTFSTTGLINKLQAQAEAQQAHASAQAAQQQLQTDLSAVQQGDQVSDYTSALAKWRQDLANNCQDADTDAGEFGGEGIVSAEESAISALQGDPDNGADPSLDSKVKNEITKATAAVNQVIDQANAINDQANANASQNPDIVPCGLGPWPAFTPEPSS